MKKVFSLIIWLYFVFIDKIVESRENCYYYPYYPSTTIRVTTVCGSCCSSIATSASSACCSSASTNGFWWITFPVLISIGALIGFLICFCKKASRIRCSCCDFSCNLCKPFRKCTECFRKKNPVVGQSDVNLSNRRHEDSLPTSSELTLRKDNTLPPDYRNIAKKPSRIGLEDSPPNYEELSNRTNLSRPATIQLTNEYDFPLPVLPATSIQESTQDQTKF